MRKSIFMGLALVAALAFVSCKSSESSYKKAYEKAKAQEMAQTNTTDQVESAPVSVTPVVTTTPVTVPSAMLTMPTTSATPSLVKVTLHKWHRTQRPACTASSPLLSTIAHLPSPLATSFVAPTPTHGSSTAHTN